jgi:excisionase family DNA binding protein
MMALRLLNSKEAADLLRVKRTTIQRWVREGVDLPYVRDGRQVKFPEKDLSLWVWKRVQNKQRKNFEE